MRRHRAIGASPVRVCKAPEQAAGAYAAPRFDGLSSLKLSHLGTVGRSGQLLFETSHGTPLRFDGVKDLTH